MKGSPPVERCLACEADSVGTKEAFFRGGDPFGLASEAALQDKKTGADVVCARFK